MSRIASEPFGDACRHSRITRIESMVTLVGTNPTRAIANIDFVRDDVLTATNRSAGARTSLSMRVPLHPLYHTLLVGSHQFGNRTGRCEFRDQSYPEV